MKKLFSLILAAAMLFAFAVVPPAAPVSAIGEGGMGRAAANLNEALNIPGGSLVFSTDTAYPWVVDGDAAKSTNEGVANSTSSVWTSFTSAAGDILQFDWISMGEGIDTNDWDGLRVYLDEVKILQKGANHPDWERFSIELTAGTHEVRFTYKKDATTDREGDCAKIDNVYVGAAILPESITVQPVELPTGRSTQVWYTVEPETANDKSVTFSTANAAIASVDANGVVTGVSEGTTTVTVTSVADPSVFGTAAVTVSAGLEIPYLKGFCMFDVNYNTLNNHIVGFDELDTANVDDLNNFGLPCYSAAFAGGNVYGYLFNSDGSDTRFFVMNANDYSVSFPGASYPTGMIAMAFDHSTQRMYGINSIGTLVWINTQSGAVLDIARISGMTDRPMTLAIDGEGNAYTLEAGESANLYSLDLQTGEASFICETGAAMRYVQSMTYDFTTGKIYWAQTFDTGKTGLYVLDPQNATSEFRGTIGSEGMELAGLYIENALPVDIDDPQVTITFLDNVANSVVATARVPVGSALDPASFPISPAHEGFTFVGWNYIAGTPIYCDTVIASRYYDPQATTAIVVLNVPEDIWGDGTGYQMLLDADADAYGSVIPPNGGALYGNGNVPDAIYDEFEYKIPANADGVLTTQNIVVRRSVAIEIPAGTYDWCIVNPTPGEAVYIANDDGNVPGRANDYVFEAGKTYTFTVTNYNSADRVNVNTMLGGTTPQNPQPGMLGDVDLNGSITISDAVLALRHGMGLETLTGQAFTNADIDSNGSVTISDAVMILRRAMGLTNSF